MQETYVNFHVVGKRLKRRFFINAKGEYWAIFTSLVDGHDVFRGRISKKQYDAEWLRFKERVALLDNGDITSSNE